MTGVRTATGEISAPAVVICAGLWAGRLLTALGIEVPVAPTRHQMCFFRRPPDLGPHPGILDRPQATYMRPETGNLTIHGLVAYDEVVDPDHYNEGADPGEVLRNAELIAQRFPAMEHGLSMGGYSGVYDNTPDHQPVLGAVPEYAGLHVDFGWSGHGFKHAPAVGDIVAQVVLDGHADGMGQERRSDGRGSATARSCRRPPRRSRRTKHEERGRPTWRRRRDRSRRRCWDCWSGWRRRSW